MPVKHNRVYPLIIGNTSATSDHNLLKGCLSIRFTRFFQYLSIMTMTVDLWPIKSTGLIISPLATSVLGLVEIHLTVWFLFSTFVFCDLGLWPLTFKINSVHLLITINMCGKVDEDTSSSLHSIVFTRWSDVHTHRLRDVLTEPQQHYYMYIPSAACCAGIMSHTSFHR